MTKKIIISLAAVAIVVGGVAAMSAFEAHIINVTAKIENALSVNPTEIMFGTVFPQEHLFKDLSIALSQSFIAEDRVDDIAYTIKQKPKPKDVEPDGLLKPDFNMYKEGGQFYGQLYGYTIDNDTDRAEYCHRMSPADASDLNDLYYINCYPVLCPYLSKTPDDAPANDTGVPAFHDPIEVALGYLSKIDQDIVDNWIIDLDVPCFNGQCAQDWTHEGWELPTGLEHETFGCDLWIEVTRVSEAPDVCEYSVVTGEPYNEPAWGTVTYVTITNEDCSTINAIKVEHSMSYTQGQAEGARAGWAGISCIEPGYSQVVGGGVWDGAAFAQGPAEIGAAAIDGENYPVYPHYTYPSPEEGWVVEAEKDR